MESLTVSNLVIKDLLDVEVIDNDAISELRGGYDRIVRQQGVPILDNEANYVHSLKRPALFIFDEPSVVP